MVFDGAMGTELYRHHIFTNQCYDELNLSRPELVEQIHLEYAQAGADVLTTNTYGASRTMLERYGLASRLEAINKAGVDLARKAADSVTDRKIYIAGSVGPQILSSMTAADKKEVLALVREQLSVLILSGVDFIIFETQTNREALLLAAEAMTPYNGFPFVLSCSVTLDNLADPLVSLSDLFAPIPEDLPQPSAFGLNCGQGPEGLLRIVEKIMPIISKPLIVQPNAGMPKEFEGRKLYYCSPEYIATYAMYYVNSGTAAVGGCCGTTPDHIREIAQMIKPLSKGRTADIVIQKEKEGVHEVPESEFSTRSKLAGKLVRNEWVETIELTPPRGYDLTSTLDKCRILQKAGIDAVNLPDGPRASSRIASLAVAERILHEVGIEPILHFCCRDRNLIGMQADLLACAAYGIHNILFITGDPPKHGNYPNATGVFDTDSIGMCSVQHRLNRGIDLGGLEISPPTNAVFGVGTDPNALDQNREISRLQKKLDSGARFIITQPVFDPDQLHRFLDQIGNLSVPIIAGVWPFTSYRNALFMKNEVPGVIVPDSIMNRMEAAAKETKEDQIKIGIEIARESLARIRDRLGGVQVSAPFGKIEISLSVLQK